MNLDFNHLLPVAEGFLTQTPQSEKAQFRDCKGKQIVRVKDHAFILVNILGMESFTIGWSLKHKTFVALHRHEGDDPNPLYTQCEKIQGIAKPILSFKIGYFARVDVFELHPYFYYAWDGAIFNDIRRIPDEYRVKFDSFLNNLKESLLPKKIVLRNAVFISDLSEKRYSVLPTSLSSRSPEDTEDHPLDLGDPLPNHSPLHSYDKPDKWEQLPSTPCEGGIIYRGEVCGIGAIKKVYKGVLKRGEEAIVIALAVINLKAAKPAIVDLEKVCAEELKGHPHIVSVLAMLQEENELTIVMPFYPYDLLEAHRQGLLPIEGKVKVLLDAAKGVDFYQEKIGVYSDLKPENIMVHFAPEGVSGLLIDFGGGIKKGSSSLSSWNEVFGSLEMICARLNHEGPLVTDRHDSWSMGAMIAYLIFSTYLPMMECFSVPDYQKNYTNLSKSLESKIEMIRMNWPPTPIKALLDKLLLIEPNSRLSMKVIIEELDSILNEMRKR